MSSQQGFREESDPGGRDGGRRHLEGPQGGAVNERGPLPNQRRQRAFSDGLS